MPDSVEIPAPVKTTTRRASVIRSASSRAVLIGSNVRAERRPEQPESGLTRLPGAAAPANLSQSGGAGRVDRQRVVEAGGLLSDLSAQLLRLERRRRRRPEGHRGQA